MSPILFPEPARELPGERVIRIALRTTHIAATGILLGGHVFDAHPQPLLMRLWLAIATGATYVAVELHGSFVSPPQGRGLLTLQKFGCCLSRHCSGSTVFGHCR